MFRLTSTHGDISTTPANAPKFTAKPEEQDEVVFALFRLRTWEVELAMGRAASRGEERAKHPVLLVGPVEESESVTSSRRDCPRWVIDQA